MLLEVPGEMPETRWSRYRHNAGFDALRSMSSTSDSGSARPCRQEQSDSGRLHSDRKETLLRVDIVGEMPWNRNLVL